MRSARRPPSKGAFFTPASPSVSRILYLPPVGGTRRPSIWTACCQTVSSGLPGIYDGQSIPAWPCSRWGLQAGPVTRATGGLLHHLFTLACVVRPSAVCFLLHFPSGCPAWVLPSTAPCGVRTFLDSAEADPRSSDGLATSHFRSERARLRPPIHPPKPPVAMPTRARRRTFHIVASAEEVLARKMRIPLSSRPATEPWKRCE